MHPFLFEIFLCKFHKTYLECIEESSILFLTPQKSRQNYSGSFYSHHFSWRNNRASGHLFFMLSLVPIFCVLINEDLALKSVANLQCLSESRRNLINWKEKRNGKLKKTVVKIFSESHWILFWWLQSTE